MVFLYKRLREGRSPPTGRWKPPWLSRASYSTAGKRSLEVKHMQEGKMPPGLVPSLGSVSPSLVVVGGRRGPRTRSSGDLGWAGPTRGPLSPARAVGLGPWGGSGPRPCVCGLSSGCSGRGGR